MSLLRPPEWVTWRVLHVMALTPVLPCARMEGDGAAKRAHGNAEHDAAQVGSPGELLKCHCCMQRCRRGLQS